MGMASHFKTIAYTNTFAV